MKKANLVFISTVILFSLINISLAQAGSATIKVQYVNGTPRSNADVMTTWCGPPPCTTPTCGSTDENGLTTCNYLNPSTIYQVEAYYPFYPSPQFGPTEAFETDENGDSSATISGCVNNEPDCSDKNDCTIDTCINPGQSNNHCEYSNKQDGTFCDDGLYCNVGESCQSGICSGGSTKDCSDEKECTDDICNENLDQCENPNEPQGTLCGSAGNCLDNYCNGPFAMFYPVDGHDTCDSSGNCVEYSCNLLYSYCTDNDIWDGINSLECNAPCDQDSDCADKCEDNVRKYSGNCDSTCTCSWQSSENCDSLDGCYNSSTGCEYKDYYCTPGACEHHSDPKVDSYDDFVNYCSGDTIKKHRLFNDFYCDPNNCVNHTSWTDDSLVENCNSLDSWSDTGSTKWVSYGQCAEKEQKERKYKDYTCSAAACTYTVTSTQWTYTGNIRNKPNGTSCDDGNGSTVNDVCKNGSCAGTPLKNCYGKICWPTICLGKYCIL
jgi:hypothetical protein